MEQRQNYQRFYTIDPLLVGLGVVDRHTNADQGRSCGTQIAWLPVFSSQHNVIIRLAGMNGHVCV